MTTWHEGRQTAHELGLARAESARTVPIGSTGGLTTADNVLSPSAIPPFDCSAMDGWAVAGDAPWKESEPILAGASPQLSRLARGEARPIATGAPVPPATATIIRSEEAVRSRSESRVLIEPLMPASAGRNIRRRGEELDRGELLVSAGSLITPPLMGLLTAVGVSEVSVRGPVAIDFIAIGDELSDDLPADARVNDSLSATIPGVLHALGGCCVSVRRAVDRPEAVAEAISSAAAPIVVTTGGTAHGPADPVRDALRRLDADMLLDGLAVRPGRSVLLSTMAEKTVLSLPGNPFAAIVDAILLACPLLAGRLGAPLPPAQRRRLPLPGRTERGRIDRVIACRENATGELVSVSHQAPSMLRGIATATHLVVDQQNGDQFAIRLPWG